MPEDSNVNTKNITKNELRNYLGNFRFCATAIIWSEVKKRQQEELSNVDHPFVKVPKG